MILSLLSTDMQMIRHGLLQHQEDGKLNYSFKNLELSEHYNRGTDKNRTKEVVNLKEMAEQIKEKLTAKEIFFLNYFADKQKPTLRI